MMREFLFLGKYLCHLSWTSE